MGVLINDTLILSLIDNLLLWNFPCYIICWRRFIIKLLLHYWDFLCRNFVTFAFAITRYLFAFAETKVNKASCFWKICADSCIHHPEANMAVCRFILVIRKHWKTLILVLIAWITVKNGSSEEYTCPLNSIRHQTTHGTTVTLAILLAHFLILNHEIAIIILYQLRLGHLFLLLFVNHTHFFEAFTRGPIACLRFKLIWELPPATTKSQVDRDTKA